jgi:DNA-binding response OmpR family regulator
MYRPCFLVADPEHAGNISTRKLVIETAKFNVITAYSGAELLETLRRFPGVDGVVLDGALFDLSLDEVIRQMKAIKPGLTTVVILPPGTPRVEAAEYQVESLNPANLLEALQTICPVETAAILKRDRELEESGE